MKVWVARELDNKIVLSSTKPIRDDSKFRYPCPGSIYELLDDPIGEGITFENSPQLIELIRKDTFVKPPF